MNSNGTKHGVTFEEGTTAWRDVHRLIDDDPQGNADCFILIGMSNKARILYCMHAEKVGRHTRLISVRRATKKERLEYTGPL